MTDRKKNYFERLEGRDIARVGNRNKVNKERKENLNSKLKKEGRGKRA